MEKVAEKRAEKDPQTAQELKNAAQDAEKGGLTDHMKEAGESIKKNQLNEARKQQREALAELEKLTKNLEDRREAELDRLRKKMRELEEQVEKLQDEQEKLQRKIREANKIADQQKRQAELEKLARKQQELKEKTGKVMDEMAKLGNDRAREAMARAAEEMEEAFKQLQRRKPQDEKQEEVLDRLEEARREMERARKRAEEELGREQIARVAEAIQRLRERQQGHVDESKRIQDGVLERKGWNRGMKASMLRLGDNQKDLGKETADLAKKDLSAAPIFARMLERSARAMKDAGERLEEIGRHSPDLQALPDAEAARFQELALRRLNQVLDALKESQENPQPLSNGGGGGGGGEDGGGMGPQGDDSLPPLAQLKLLKTMQKEVNERTAAFKKKHPNLANLNAKEKTELQDIRREQKEVADLLDRLTQPPGDDPEDEDNAKEKGNNEGEKK
jgi:DNA repair exonuclease SbcCD ATPase subunit